MGPQASAMSVSPLKGYDVIRDKERDSVQSLSHDATQYAKQAELGELMTEMLTATILAKPDKPIDFLIDLLSGKPAKRFAVCAPPTVPIEAAGKAVSDQEGGIPVSLPPLLDEAKDRIIDGKTVEEHGADGACVPDHIVVKLISERLSKPDCMEKGWVLENLPTTKGQAQRLPAQLTQYHKEMRQVVPMFAASMQQFDVAGPAEVESAIPNIRRAVEKKKVTDPGLSKKPGNQ